jgi:hypothetical protein
LPPLQQSSSGDAIMSQIEIHATTASDQPNTDAPSSRRIAASRANGALSSGPTTPEGHAALAASPRNFRHGMLAQTVVLASESRARFEALVDELLSEFRPITKAERTLVETMASARWRQMRAVCFQKNDLDLEIGRQQSASPTPHTPPVAATLAFRSLSDKSNSLSNAMRHEAGFERQFNRALRQLKTLLDAHGKDGVEPTTAADPISTWDDASQTFDNDSEFAKK